MARRATTIKGLRASASSSLLLDAGNSLYNAEGSTTEPAERTRGQTSVEVLNRLGYDAVALGDKDLLLTKEELLKRISEAKSFAFVSANLIDRSTGKLVVKPYVIKEMAGHKVALIGITGGASTGDWIVTPPLDAARDYVRQVQSQADVVILLSNAGPKLNKLIASEAPGIDVILSGGTNDPLGKETLIGKTLVAQDEWSNPGHAGRYVGHLRVSLDRAGDLTGHEWKAIELGPSVADDPDMAAWVATLLTQ